MKKIFMIILVLAAFFVGRIFNSDKSGLRVVIDRHTTEKGLAEIIEKAKLVNLNLTIDETGYNADGGLERIKGKVDFGDRSTGTFQSDRVGKIIIKRDLDAGDGGFSIVVKKRWI